MSKDLLKVVIDKGVRDNLNTFFLGVSNDYSEVEDDLSIYDDDRFANFQTIGEIVFNPNEKMVVVTAEVSEDLTERSGKKNQYEKAKKILKDYMKYDAGIFVFSDPLGSFRFSLVYGQAEGTKKSWSNFRRFTYFVSRDQTNKTFLERVGGCDFSSLDVVKDAFSVEKVNKEFYTYIARFFYRLTGYEQPREMKLPSVPDDDKETYQDFAVRLIGRIIFCWFLKHKKSAGGIPLISDEALSVSAVQNHPHYYHSILEPLFFEVMNQRVKDRKPNDVPQSDLIPFLNGGLFEPHRNDCYQDMPNYALKIPDGWFKDFFSVLEKYNFTIDENSIVDAEVSVDPEMLGRIFENLLAEVNPETGETVRKATGSYYTPRTIVDYMAEESLKQYLLEKTGINEDTAINLLSYEVEDITLTEKEKDSIVAALDEIRIIDPACGSGAFPIGLLHKMLLVLQKVDPGLSIWLRNHLDSIEAGVFRDKLLERIKKENWEYVKKLLIIQNSIYGVDIQTIAVEIAKLRCFLSLIVDEKIEDAKENRGVEALPNLEFKFVAANSLIGIPSVTNRQVGLGIANEQIIRMKELRNKYLRSYGVEKEQIKEDFMKTRGNLIEQNIKWVTEDALALQLANWNPFSNEACGWFDPDWMFGIEDGFDIIIANPPYIGEKGHKEIFRRIKQGVLNKYYQGKMDVFYFFFHLAIDLGRAGAQIAFITTNYYPTATGAGKLRRDFKARTIVRRLCNFNELKIFEAALGQHNMVTILSKGQDQNSAAETCITARTGIAVPQTLQTILDWQDKATKYYRVCQHDLYEGEQCYIRLTGGSVQSKDFLNTVLGKLQDQGKSLRPKFCDINNGIHTEADYLSQGKFAERNDKNARVGDGIYVLDRENEDDSYWIIQIEKSPGEKKYLKPFYKNSDVGRYWTNTNTQRRVIYINKREDDIDDLPQIKRHLYRFKRIIDASSDNSPYLHRPKNKTIFVQPKIVAPHRSNTNTFGYNEIPWYAASDVFFITPRDKDTQLKYILALLNSKLYYVWLYHKGKRKGETLELITTPLSEIPIKEISAVEQKPFIDIVDQILAITKDEDYLSNPAKQSKVKELESQIDQMVYELYGLTEEEIGVVEGTFNKK